MVKSWTIVWMGNLKFKFLTDIHLLYTLHYSILYSWYLLFGYKRGELSHFPVAFILRWHIISNFLQYCVGFSMKFWYFGFFKIKWKLCLLSQLTCCYHIKFLSNFFLPWGLVSLAFKYIKKQCAVDGGKMFQCKKKQLCMAIAIPIKKHCHITSGTVDERQLARKVKYSMASSPVGCCHRG